MDVEVLLDVAFLPLGHEVGGPFCQSRYLVRIFETRSRGVSRPGGDVFPPAAPTEMETIFARHALAFFRVRRVQTDGYFYLTSFSLSARVSRRRGLDR
jgi:hypothetical protein